MSTSRRFHVKRYALYLDAEPSIVIYAKNIRAAREEAEVIGYHSCYAIEELPT